MKAITDVTNLEPGQDIYRRNGFTGEWVRLIVVKVSRKTVTIEETAYPYREDRNRYPHEEITRRFKVAR